MNTKYLCTSLKTYGTNLSLKQATEVDNQSKNHSCLVYYFSVLSLQINEYNHKKSDTIFKKAQ